MTVFFAGRVFWGMTHLSCLDALFRHPELVLDDELWGEGVGSTSICGITHLSLVSRFPRSPAARPSPDPSREREGSCYGLNAPACGREVILRNIA